MMTPKGQTENHLPQEGPINKNYTNQGTNLLLFIFFYKTLINPLSLNVMETFEVEPNERYLYLFSMIRMLFII